MLMYGESAQGLSESRGLSLDEAKATIKKVLKAMPNIDKTSQVVQAFAKQRGYVETISGHVRRLHDAMSNNKFKQSRAIRQSFNAVIQGSGAVCTNTALIILRKLIYKYHLKSRIVITVHDSIVFDVHPSEIMIIPVLAKRVMEHLPISQLILNVKDFPDLKIADKYQINDQQFRFPLFAEGEWGKYYADGLDFDINELKQLGGNAEKYYEYGMKCKYVSDTYNTKLSSVDDENKKAEIVKIRDDKLAKIKSEYFN